MAAPAHASATRRASGRDRDRRAGDRIGEAGVGGGSTRDVIEKQLRPMLIGEDPLLIERLWQKMFRAHPPIRPPRHRHERDQRRRRGIWDIAGKVAGLPLYRLFGRCRDRVEAYASGGFYQEGKGVDELAGEAEGPVPAASKA